MSIDASLAIKTGEHFTEVVYIGDCYKASPIYAEVFKSIRRPKNWTVWNFNGKKAAALIEILEKMIAEITARKRFYKKLETTTPKSILLENIFIIGDGTTNDVLRFLRKLLIACRTHYKCTVQIG